MTIEFEDKANKVSVNPRDLNKIIVQEEITHVEISSGGPQGIQGSQGIQGIQGIQGAQGIQGEPGTYTVSATAPSNPRVGDTWFNSTTSQMYIRYDNYWVETSSSYLGPANVLAIGSVTTGAPGSSALATITGTPPSQTLNLTIPTGTNGVGVPSGGTTNQVLAKINGTNYNTQWVDTSTIAAPSAIRWSPAFQAVGMVFTGTNSTYPTYNSYYVKYGQMVTFWIAIDMTTVTNFGTGQFKVDLPFAPLPTAANHFNAWAWVNPSLPADDLNGHVVLVADHTLGNQTLDLHWQVATTSNPKPVIESLLTQGNPVTFTTASKMYVNGTYISAS